jgi:hypothetical protein
MARKIAESAPAGEGDTAEVMAFAAVGGTR